MLRARTKFAATKRDKLPAFSCGGGEYAISRFDGTQNEPRGNRIAIAYGRDAADVALITQFGALELKSMKVTVREADLRK